MSLYESSKSILDSIMTSAFVDSNKMVGIKSEDFFVISGNNSPRWIIPVNAPVDGVLSQWQPYGVYAKVKWYSLRLLYKFTLLEYAPYIIKLKSSGESNKDTKNTYTALPVIYIGTPGPHQKAVITLIDKRTGELLSVVKVALGKKACESIANEANALEYLSALGVDNTPKLISRSESLNYTVQTVVKGKLASRKLNEIQLEWLVSLPRTGKKTTFSLQKMVIENLIESSYIVLPDEVLKNINKALLYLDCDDVISHVLVHGDFAPWNIKQRRKNECSVIDWEDALFDGFPLWDLCHYYFIQGCLFEEKNVLSSFLSNLLVLDYIKSKNISEKNVVKFIIIYTLFSIFSHKTSVEYRNYLVSIINKVLKR